MGQAGGYASNGPTITNDKFILQGMICPQTDGSFWITDLATENRTMHFSASRTFIEDIQYARSYSAAGDQNNTARVFQNFVEYQIDYSKPFTQNQGWTPVKNWSYLGTTNLEPIDNYGSSDGLVCVATLSNGRTYALVSQQYTTSSQNKLLVELTSSGLRSTGYTPAYSMTWMDKDGSLLYGATAGSTMQFDKLVRTGFDGSGNPQYAGSPTLLGTGSLTNTWDVNSITPSALPYYAPCFLQMDNGLLMAYNPTPHSAGMHLGAMNPSTGQWQWAAMPGAGPFNGEGNYDTNTWYGGNRVMVNGSNVVVGYNGEGWHGSGQANQYMQYNSDGLFIGQFGTPTGAAVWAAYGAAGNSFSPFFASVNGTLYLYNNDESDRSMQRWEATGMNTIQETSVGVGLGVPAMPSGLTATATSPVNIPVPNGDFGSDAAGFYINTNNGSHGPFVGPMTATLTGWAVTANPSTDYSGVYGGWNPYGGIDNTVTNYPASGNSSTNYSGSMPGGATNMFFYYPGEQLTGNIGSRVAQTGANITLTTTGISAAAVLGTTYTASIYYANLAANGSNNGPNVTLNILAHGVVVGTGTVTGLAPGSPWTQVTANWTATSHIGEAIQLQVVANNFLEGTQPWWIPNFGLTAATLTSVAAAAIPVPDADFTDTAAYCINSNTGGGLTFTLPMNATLSGWNVSANPSTANGGYYAGWEPYGVVDNITSGSGGSPFNSNAAWIGNQPASNYQAFMYYPGEQYLYGSVVGGAQPGASLRMTTTGISLAAVAGTTYTATILYANVSWSSANVNPSANVALNILANGVVVGTGALSGLAQGAPWTPVTATWTATGPYAGQAIQLQVVATNFLEGPGANQQWQVPTFGFTHATLTASVAPQTQIYVSWMDDSSNETGFKIDQATNSNFTTGLTTVTVGANTTTYSATGLSAGTTYYYRVRATNASGDSTNTSTASATATQGSIPAAPSGLSAATASQTQINLSWTDNSNNETGFKIDQATNSTFTTGLTTVTVAANTTSYNATGLSAGTRYYYRVRATNGSGDSANTSTASATTQTTLTITATTPGASETGPVSGAFTVTRAGTSGALTANYTISGSATNGTDYTTLSGSVVIADGQSSATVTVAPADDALAELTENVILTLGSGTGYVVDSPSNATVTIADNDSTDLPSNLTALWRFDEGSGTTAYDSANGTAQNGTLTNSPTSVAGRIGKALQFNGTSQYVTVNSATDINPTAAISLAVWAKSDPTQSNWNAAQTFLSKRNAYILGPVNSTSKSIQFQLYIGGAWKTLSYTPTFDITQWHHYAATYDGANMKLYMDGAQVGSSQAQTGAINADTGILSIGRDDGQSRYLKGFLDEARVYNTAISAASVTALYNQAALSVTGLTVNSSHGASYSVQTNALATGINQYGDTSNTFTTIPGKYLGSTFIRSANADSKATGSNFLSFSVNQPVTVYILYSDGYTTKPSWLNDFTDTTDNIVTTKGTFSVYKKTLSAGTITLGANSIDGLNDFGMYDVLIMPLV